MYLSLMGIYKDAALIAINWHEVWKVSANDAMKSEASTIASGTELADEVQWVCCEPIANLAGL